MPIPYLALLLADSSMWTDVNGINALLAIIAMVCGAAASIGALYVGKVLAEMRSEIKSDLGGIRLQIQSVENKVDKEILEMLLKIGERYADKTEAMQQIGRISAANQAAHRRIDNLTLELRTGRRDSETMDLS